MYFYSSQCWRQCLSHYYVLKHKHNKKHILKDNIKAWLTLHCDSLCLYTFS